MRSRFKFVNRSVAAMALIVLAALAAGGCGGTPVYFAGGVQEFEEKPDLAILPPVNLSSYEHAPDIVVNSLLVEMLQTDVFNVTDPGLVENIILEKRVRVTDRLSLEALRELGEALEVTYLMVGTINEFGFLQDGGSNLPMVSISLRIVTCANGQIVWATSHSRRGDDSESVFGIGRIETLDQLATVTVHEMTRTLRQ